MKVVIILGLVLAGIALILELIAFFGVIGLAGVVSHR
jgi:hypothetical protein